MKPELQAVPIGEVLVSIDVEQRVAYLACQEDSGIRWKGFPLRTRAC